MPQIQRTTPMSGAVIALTAVIGTTGTIPYATQSGGTIHIPNGSTITSLTFYSQIDGADYALYDSTGTPVTLTVAGNNAYPIPAACFGCEKIKVLANASGNIICSLKG